MTTTTTQPYDLAFAFNAFGGFKVEQDFPLYRPIGDGFRPYDLSDAIQIRYSVIDLNYKIHVINESTAAALSQNSSTCYTATGNSGTGTVNDTLEITSEEFIDNVNTSNIISMGKMSTLYSDFLDTVTAYFGSPIVLNNNIFNINNGVFDASAYLHLINGGTFDINGTFVSDFSGAVHVYDMNAKLNSAVKRNLFNNRNESSSVVDGFVVGDLIYVPDGMTVTLKLDIDHGALIDIYSGPANLKAIDDQLNYYNSATRVRKTTTYSNTNITQTYTVPIVIVASDIASNYNFDRFGESFAPVLTQLGARNWNFVSLNSTGQYQNAVDISGHVYISQDYGRSWCYKYDIGASEVNTINVSHEGQHQTACNPSAIYISNDFGSTWNKTLDLQGVQIYLSVSLNGQYQSVVSAGDSVYSSSDYGVTWLRLNDPNSDLYNSIQAFPSCATAMSFNGQHQVIVSESIYYSNDYGATFNDIFTPADPFDDRNWIDVDIASDGHMIIAIDNGGFVYKSDDYGGTWTVLDDPLLSNSILWRNVSMSGDGRYISLLQQNGFIFSSNDYGATWEQNTDPELANRQWRCIDVSTSGHYQAACEFNGFIYVSSLL